MRLASVIFASVAAAFLTGPSVAKPVDLAFINSVGGIKIKSPARDDKGWVLPVEANVAGLKAVTVSPTQLNSGLICEKVSARITEHAIFITVHTGSARGKKSPECPPAALGNIDPGEYDVYYDTGETGGLTKASLAPSSPLGRISIMATSQILY